MLYQVLRINTRVVNDPHHWVAKIGTDPAELLEWVLDNPPRRSIRKFVTTIIERII